ncbi:MAG: hypothetical protein H6621_01380 [Halobacteriovoraceae bacterium]|nr:hypothetical protein [Halobacteriovoraceae bacterium]
MATRFFPRYQTTELNIHASFLGSMPHKLPEIISIDDLSLTGFKMTISGTFSEVIPEKIAIRYKQYSFYFKCMVVWVNPLPDEKREVGIQIFAPTYDIYQRWLQCVKEIDYRLNPFTQKAELEKENNVKTVAEKPHASLY